MLFIWVVGLISSGAYGILARNSQSYGELRLSDFYGCVVVLAIACGLLFFVLQRNRQQIPLGCLLGFAIVFRILGLLTYPIFEDDFFRYLWDGRMFVETGSPYSVAPSSYFIAEHLSERFESILDLINHPEIATIYGPTNQYLFGLSYLMAPGELWPLKIFYALCDLAIVIVLLKFAKPNWVLLYAWSPLIIKEFSITAHPDIFGALLVLLAYWLFKEKNLKTAALLLALACGVKVFALVAVPFLLRFDWRAWFVFAVTILVLGLPFGVVSAWIPEGLSAMSGAWIFNAPLYIFAQDYLSFNTVKLLATSCFLIFWLFYYVDRIKNKNSTAIRLDWVFAALLVCSPVLNPWYLVWVLPFSVIYPSVWAWVSSVMLLLAYSSGINLDVVESGQAKIASYEIPRWIVALEFSVIILISLIFSLYYRWRSKHFIF